MSTSVVLRAARALLARGWTQGAYARDNRENSVDEQSDKAVTFCLAGAVWRAGGNPAPTEVWSALRRVGVEYPSNFNDHHTQAEVLEVFDRAIEEAEKENA